jgi:signal transduction histidine kinase
MEATNNRYEEEMKTLLENCNMYVWHYELGSELITFSRSLKQVDFSRTMEEHIESMYEDEQEQARQMLQNLPNVKKSFSMVHHFRHTPPHNRPCWFAISGMPLHDKQGRCIGQFGVIRIITDLMEAQQRLKEETSRAEDSGRLKSAFLANMTHEIRTPLNAIVGFSDLLPVIDEPEERMEFIRIIRNNCDMLLRLINDILEASSMGQALAIEPEEVDFAQVFDDICQTLAQRVQEPGVEFIKDNPYTTLRTVLDKGRVQQVLTNFTTNAVKYTHEGHIKVGYRQEVRAVGGAEPRQGLYFYCEDTGAGIPKEKQPKVFERFVKLNDFVQGTGLGLSICQSIADRCGGEIGVSSEGEGHGSTFWFWIPCEEIKETKN